MRKSEDYGKKIMEDLAAIAGEILQNRIDIVNLQARIDEAMKEESTVSMQVKRQSE